MLRRLILMFTLLTLVTFLSGCLNFEKMELVVNIKKQGLGEVEYNIYDITSTEKGEKGKKEIQDLINQVKKSGGTQFSKDLGLKNPVATLVYDKSGTLNGKISGRTKSLFDLTRHLFTENREKLVKGKQFLIQWKNNILTIKLDDSNVTARKSSDSRVSIVVKTEGIFHPGTTGKISKNRKETRFKENENIVLIIGGLAEKKSAKPTARSKNKILKNNKN